MWSGGDVRFLVECCFTSTETLGLSGTGAQTATSHTAPVLCPVSDCRAVSKGAEAERRIEL